MQLINKRDIKTFNAILYFAKNVKHPTITKIIKLLYLLDFMHFKEAARPVTGLKYRTWKYGPVPPTLYYRLKNLDRNDEWYNFIRIGEEIDEVKDKKTIKIIPHKNPDMSVFSKREARLLEKIATIFKEIKPTDISEYSHLKNHPWEITKNTKGENKEIDYMLALDNEATISHEEAEELYREIEEMWEKFGSE